ncbi:hypothetical protein [Mariniphaga sp.]|uniref:hypothetical protein n=1 Tax=Mariniphaga sp. TaxID=1954475 RepID=UPI003561FFAA
MEKAKKTPLPHDSTYEWQNKLLPWFIIVPTVLISVFIILATRQVTQINKRMQTTQDTTFVNSLMDRGDVKLSGDLEYYKWLVLVKMEQESFYRRYNQAELLLMSRIFTKYLGFFTGMILAIVGSVFIIGRIKEDTTDFEGSISEKARFKLITSSPGIIFGIMGTALMMTTILHHRDIEVRDKALYLKSAYEIVLPQNYPAQKKDSIQIDPDAFQQLFDDN